jgi:capsular polysaccharide transport system permease protein
VKNIKRLISSRIFAIAVYILPVCAVAMYYAFLAEDRYASVTVVSVHDTGSMAATSSSASSSLGQLLGGSSVGSALSGMGDTLFIEGYVQSMDMLLKLDKRLNLRQHYSRPGRDPFAHLAKDANNEEFLDYFQSRLNVTYDELSGQLTIEVEAFEPAFSNQVVRAILEESEAYVNENAHRIAREKLRFAEGEVQTALDREKKAKGAVTAFQTKYKLLDPTAQATGSTALLNSLMDAQAKQEADLKAALSYLSEDSLQVRTLRAQLAATQSQVEAERARATTNVNGNLLPALAVEYQGLLTQAAFTNQVYQAALTAVEQSRIDALRKLKTIVVQEPPTLPDYPRYPRRFIDWLTFLVVFTMIYTIGRLILATIREHQD